MEKRSPASVERKNIAWQVDPTSKIEINREGCLQPVLFNHLQEHFQPCPFLRTVPWVLCEIRVIEWACSMDLV